VRERDWESNEFINFTISLVVRVILEREGRVADRGVIVSMAQASDDSSSAAPTLFISKIARLV
jgi:hypothetical protein